MGMRKTPKEILHGIDHGFSEEAWEDLASDWHALDIKSVTRA